MLLFDQATDSAPPGTCAFSNSLSPTHYEFGRSRSFTWRKSAALIALLFSSRVANLLASTRIGLSSTGGSPEIFEERDDSSGFESIDRFLSGFMLGEIEFPARSSTKESGSLTATNWLRRWMSPNRSVFYHLVVRSLYSVWTPVRTVESLLQGTEVDGSLLRCPSPRAIRLSGKLPRLSSFCESDPSRIARGDEHRCEIQALKRMSRATILMRRNVNGHAMVAM